MRLACAQSLQRHDHAHRIEPTIVEQAPPQFFATRWRRRGIDRFQIPFLSFDARAKGMQSCANETMITLIVLEMGF